jgi:signal transduction histidine kinase
VAPTALAASLSLCPPAAASAQAAVRNVVLLTPDNTDGAPGGVLVRQSLRDAFAAGSSEPIQIRNEYLDLSRFQDAAQRRVLVNFLRQKYEGQKIDLVIAALSSVLDFALEFRREVFPGVPIVFLGLDQQEVQKRSLPSDVVGVPIKMDLLGTLELALRLQPLTRRVFVVTGSSPFDVSWENVARQAFRPYEGRLELVYLSGLPMADLVKRVAKLPSGSIVLYLHVFQDGAGQTFIPAKALDVLAAAANAPIYGHVDSYVGRGIVGGRVMSFEMAGKNAAALSLRILSGARPETVSVSDLSPNVNMIDWRQLRRWGLSEDSLPPGADVRFREPGLWDLYRWHILGALSLFALQTGLIVALLAQRADRRRAEESLRLSQIELRKLTGRLLQAHEDESRRIARELHDDLGQGLALLTVELDLLRQKPPQPSDGLGTRLQKLLAHVKQLSSSVHDMSHQLHPSKLEQLGLVAAIGGLCKELTASHGLAVSFTDREVPTVIAPDTAVCLYRIAQEALRNTVKHSGAQHAEVTLSGTASTISLGIVDDGVGFDPRRAQGKGGLGLVSMRERVLQLGGELTIDSQRSGGTRLHVSVPLRKPAPDAI